MRRNADAEADAAASVQLVRFTTSELYEMIGLLNRLENDGEAALTTQEEQRLYFLMNIYRHALRSPQ